MLVLTVLEALLLLLVAFVSAVAAKICAVFVIVPVTLLPTVPVTTIGDGLAYGHIAELADAADARALRGESPLSGDTRRQDVLHIHRARRRGAGVADQMV